MREHTAPQAIGKTCEEAAAQIVAVEVVVAVKRLAGKDEGSDGVDVDDGDHQRGDHQQGLAVAGHRLDGARENVVVGDDVEEMEAVRVAVGENTQNCTR